MKKVDSDANKRESYVPTQEELDWLHHLGIDTEKKNPELVIPSGGRQPNTTRNVGQNK